MRIPLLVVVCVACAPPPPLTVVVAPEQRELAQAFFEHVPLEGEVILTAPNPASSLPSGGFRVAAAVGLDAPPGSYRVEGGNGRFVIRASDGLGLQYGLAHLLEEAGFRFFHPYRTRAPERLEPPKSVDGSTHTPEIAVRGLHLHTLHPIEGYFDFWEPGAENLARARQTIDWLVKNRANYLQYPALDDVLSNGAAWREHTRQILDYAHLRGVRVGVGVQLFGKSNLQRAFDLLDEPVSDPAAEMRRRLAVLLEGMPFDAVSLSFGEFSAAQPDELVSNVNRAYAVMQELSPGIEVNAIIHLGDQPELRVTYRGETILYYFLVKFADPRILPYVHTVMYFNLFEDAGGAYHHDDFYEHRDFLLDRMRSGQRGAYQPESAYWIAFDNPVPTWLPLYVRSRWLDLQQIRAGAGRPLDEHTLFTSGWEWGYWQTDYATLRMSYRLPERWDEPYEHMFGPEVAAVVRRVGEAQHQGLIGRRLAAYLAGRDQLMDAGELVGIVSQPDRVSFDELWNMSPDARARFVADVLVPLETMAQAHASAKADLDGHIRSDDVWLTELGQGLAITAARARYVHALYRAVATQKDTGSDGGWLDEALAELEAAKPIVSARHRQLHFPDARRLLKNVPNATVYQYGYLREAHSLCFWNRERVQVQRLLRGSTESQPACVL